MKNAVLFVMLVIFPAASVLARESETLARVQKIDGKEVYILNEPVRSYEFVDDIRTGIKWTSLLTRGIINEHVNDKTNQFVRRAARKLEKDDKAFDAIIYRGGKRVEAIRFTDAGENEQLEGLARVTPINGITTFVMAEPVDNYLVVEDIGNGVKLIPLLTYGIVNNSIQRDIQSLIRRSDNKDIENFALIYQTGRHASLIVFQE